MEAFPAGSLFEVEILGTIALSLQYGSLHPFSTTAFLFFYHTYSSIPQSFDHASCSFHETHIRPLFWRNFNDMFFTLKANLHERQNLKKIT